MVVSGCLVGVGHFDDEEFGVAQHISLPTTKSGDSDRGGRRVRIDEF